MHVLMLVLRFWSSDFSKLRRYSGKSEVVCLRSPRFSPACHTSTAVWLSLGRVQNSSGMPLYRAFGTSLWSTALSGPRTPDNVLTASALMESWFILCPGSICALFERDYPPTFIWILL